MSIFAKFARLARRVFLLVAVALILFWLPIEVLFRLTSWTLFMPSLDIVYEVAMMIVLLVLVSAGLTLLIAGIGCALIGFSSRTVTETIEEAIGALAAFISAVLIVLFFLRALKIWLELVAGISFTLGAAKLLVVFLVIGIFAAWAWRHGVVAAGNAIRSRLAKGNKVVLILIVCAGLVVATHRVILHDFHEVSTNPIPAPRSGMPNIILLSIDSLSAEDMSLYGYHLNTTPRLDEFARESYVFDNFFSSSNWTTPSVASFISGLYPATSGVQTSYGYFLEGDRRKNLGQVLLENGFLSAAIVANTNGHPLTLQIADSFSATTEMALRRSQWTNRIFEMLFRLKNYRTSYWLFDMLQPAFAALDLWSEDESSFWPPELQFDRVWPLLAALEQPVFIWAHINPPHAPYLPAAQFKYKFGNFKEFSKADDYEQYVGYYPAERQTEVDRLRLRYDEFILDTDYRVGNFLEKLRAIGRFDDSIIIVTADHGESFTKNFYFHGGPYLHQPLIHIPLIVHLPGQTRGKRIPFYAGQVDLLPTVMNFLELRIPEWAEGESLKATMLEGKPTSHPKFSMNLHRDSRFAPPSKGTIAVMQDGWKLVRYLATGKEELYHLALDPGEAANIVSSNPEQAKKMRDLIYIRFKLER